MNFYPVGLAAFCLLVACQSAAPMAGSSIEKAVTQPGQQPPRVDVFGRSSPEAFTMASSVDPADRIQVRVSYGLIQSEVRLSFSYETSDPGSPHTTTEARASRIFPLAFYPTTIRYIGEQKLAVAGMDCVSGDFRIEVWKLGLPALDAIPKQAGEIQYVLRASVLESVALGFSPLSADGFGMVDKMWRNRVLGGENVIVQNYPERALYSVDLDSGVVQKIVSPLDSVGSMAPVPELQLDWTGYYGPVRHSTRGDLYVLTQYSDNAPPSNVKHSLFMWDSNLDGLPDLFELVSKEDEIAQGLTANGIWDFDWQ